MIFDTNSCYSFQVPAEISSPSTSAAMASDTILAQGDYLQDEIYALTLQMAEWQQLPLAQKGKQRLGKITLIDEAADTFEAEIRQQIDYLRDVVLAHSIAEAIETDADAIATVVEAELQSEQDRALAISMNTGEARSSVGLPSVGDQHSGTHDDVRWPTFDFLVRVTNEPQESTVSQFVTYKASQDRVAQLLRDDIEHESVSM